MNTQLFQKKLVVLGVQSMSCLTNSTKFFFNPLDKWEKFGYTFYMRTREKIKWILEPIPHLQTVSFMKGEGFYSTKEQAEHALETWAQNARLKENPRNQQIVYNLIKTSYQIRKITTHELY